MHQQQPIYDDRVTYEIVDERTKRRQQKPVASGGYTFSVQRRRVVWSTGIVQSDPKWASAKQKYDNSARDSIQDLMATTIQQTPGETWNLSYLKLNLNID